ncbi:MAG: hypothetical protein ACI8RD_010658 [Bacillariaceae sp.]|jgi:hypothetical protein
MSKANNNDGYNNERSASGDGINNNDNAADNDGESEQESVVDKMKRIMINFGHSTKLWCFKAKKQTQFVTIDFKVTQIKKKFGIDYLTLIENNEPATELKRCLKIALKDIAVLQDQIDDHIDQIDDKEQEVNNEKIVAPPPKSVTKKMEKGGDNNNNNEIQVQLPTATIDEIHDHDSKNGSSNVPFDLPVAETETVTATAIPIDQQQQKKKKKKKKSTAK